MDHRTDDKYKVLLLDYGPSDHITELTSSMSDCTFIHMPDKEQACDYFFNNNIDLVLLDHSPERPCLEPLKFFKSTKPSIPVIVSTAFGSEDLAVKVFRIGARDYLRKPPLIDELRSSIGNALGIRKVSSIKKNNNYLNGIYRAIDYIHRNYATKINLTDVTREAGMSISCFVRTFKKHSGITFTVYVNRLRIAKAIGIIEKENLSMSEIAFSCGFTNQFHFTRTFKKIMKMTPSRYKKTVARATPITSD
jgi:YesN/AraC family two-component response regulator